MKKLALIILISFFTLFPSYSFTSGNYNYTILDEEAKTCKITGRITGVISSSITIPSEVTYNKVTYKVTEIGTSAFSNLSSTIQKVTIGDNVEIIGENAFYGLDELTSLEIGSKVIEIKDGAFMNCIRLNQITIPDNVLKIGNSCFKMRETPLIPGSTVVIGNGVKEIGDFAFSGCALKNVEIGNSLERVGEAAFSGMTYSSELDLSHIKFIGKQAFEGSTIQSLIFGDNIEEISDKAFNSCSGFTELIIRGEGVKFGKNVFANCKSLKTLKIGEKITEIGNSMFKNCTRLAEIQFGKGLLNIQAETFSNCLSLSEVILPSNLKTIGNKAFNNCSALYSIEIGKNVESIGSNVFIGCSKLLSVTSLNPNPPIITGITFEEITTTNGILVVPQGSESKYSISNYWLEFKKVQSIEITPSPGEDSSNIDITAVLYMIPDEDRSFNDLLNEGVAASWESSDEGIAEVNKKGRVDAYEFGRCYIYAKNADGETIAVFEIFVCPTVLIQYGNGKSYEHHVIYNSTPRLYIAAPEGYEIVSVFHDGEDITEIVRENEGYYTPSTPITDNTVLSVNLNNTTSPGDLNGDGVVDVIDLNILLEIMMNEMN